MLLTEQAKVQAHVSALVEKHADEGKPSTFKDRVILTKFADLVFEGMTIAAYAIGPQMELYICAKNILIFNLTCSKYYKTAVRRVY